MANQFEKRGAMRRRDFIGSAAALAALSTGTIAKAARRYEKVDTIVIGAGLSGLHTAQMLADEGRKVLILEARDRVGGRVLSLDDVNASPEAGANTMLAAYGRTIDLAQRLKLPLIDMSKRPPAMPPGVHVGGKSFTIEQWRAAPENPFKGDRRKLHPGSIVPIEAAMANMFESADGWCDPANAGLDISMQRFLTDRGFSAEEIALAYNANPGYGRVAEETSLLNWLFVAAFFRAQRIAGTVEYAVAGGNSRLPEAMAKAFGGEIRLSTPISAIRSTTSGAEVVCVDGSRIRADHVVCSVPLAPLRKVAFDAPLPALHRAAIFEAPQMMITQTHLEVSAPFWEDDGLPADLWTDTPLGVLSSVRGGASATEVTSLTCWARGDKAARLDKMSEPDAGAFVLAELERVRPAAKGKVRVAGFKSWQTDPFSAGDWVVWGPGQATTLPQACGQAAGRIHFCGEHTALSSRGMEGALESAERVALEIMAP